MINNKKVLAITLARGGSKAVKKKNIANICGKPLLQYTTDEVKKSKYIDKYIVSTDADDIKKVCEDLDVEYYNRSDEFATSTAKTSDALLEVINNIDEDFDYMVEIMCTNPLKTIEDIDGCIEKIENTDADSVASVVRIWDHHPARVKYIEDDVLKDFYPEENHRRQDLEPPAYVRNGSIYITSMDRMLKYKNRLTGILRPYIMSEERTINIDEPLDLELARILLGERLMSKKDIRKIICIAPIKHVDGAIEALRECGEVIYAPYISKADARKKIINNKINTIFCNPSKQVFKIDKELLSGTGIDTICTASTGTNHIDIAYCKINNISVLHIAKDYEILKTITSTAEMAFTLTLVLIRNLPRAMADVRKYEWDFEKYPSRQIDHLTVGIIGYGRLGEIFARFSKPFFKNIMITDPYKKIGSSYMPSSLDSLLEDSDVITLHVHLKEDTYHMINEESIKKMKDGAYLINTSRGDIVDEAAVIAAIRSGKMKGYAADVISDEYKNGIRGSELIKAMNEGLNIVISPHMAGATKEAMEIAYLHVISKLKKYII